MLAGGEYISFEFFAHRTKASGWTVGIMDVYVMIMPVALMLWFDE